MERGREWTAIGKFTVALLEMLIAALKSALKVESQFLQENRL